MFIQNYSFGKITVDEKQYCHDVIIFPDKIHEPWWRKEGHVLNPEDIQEVIIYKPCIVVIGKGFFGRMKISDATKSLLEENQITCIEANTKQACDLFNTYVQKKEKVVGAFHLTC